MTYLYQMWRTIDNFAMEIIGITIQWLLLSAGVTFIMLGFPFLLVNVREQIEISAPPPTHASEPVDTLVAVTESERNGAGSEVNGEEK